MRPGSGTAPAATAGTNGRSAAATTASGSACPRLTGGTVRLKDPGPDCRSDDLTATTGAQAIAKTCGS